MIPPGGGEVVGDSPDRRVEIVSDHPSLHATVSRFGPRRDGADLHVHRRHTDLFYVLEGELTVRLGTVDEAVAVPAGMLARVPPLVVHGFRNAGDADVRYLNFHAPGVGFADYMRALRDGRTLVYDQEEPPAEGERSPTRAIIGGATVHGGRVALLAEVPEIGIAEVLGAGVRPAPCPPPAHGVVLRARGGARAAHRRGRPARRGGLLGPGSAGRPARRGGHRALPRHPHAELRLRSVPARRRRRVRSAAGAYTRPVDAERFAEHLNHPHGRGHVPAEAFSGAAGGAACGDLVRIDLALDGECVAAAGFEASGCGAAIAAASAAVTLAEGAPLLAAARIGAREVADELGGLSPGKFHAAELAADALHQALGAAAAARARAARPRPGARSWP